MHLAASSGRSHGVKAALRTFSAGCGHSGHHDEPGELAERQKKIAYHYSEILKLLGEDVDRDGLVKTPMRAAKAMTFLTKGYRQELTEITNKAVFEEQHNEIVIVRNIEFFSMCEHHLLPFRGKVSVGYIPDGNVLGLSKTARIVELFSRRLQVQERLTREVAEAIEGTLKTRAVGVLCEAEHMCMSMRGVRCQHATTITTVMRGKFETDPSMRKEFLDMVGRGRH